MARLGCLIEKGRIGTIYFGHRSLHAFLVTEHLIAKDFDGAFAQRQEGRDSNDDAGVANESVLGGAMQLIRNGPP